MNDEHTDPVDQASLRRAGAWMLAAAVLWWVAAAALIPAEDYFVGETAHAEAVSIADHVGMFRAFHVVALLGVAAAAVGVTVLAHAFRRPRPFLLRVAVVLALVGTAGWLAEVVVRLSATVARARDVAAGSAAASGEPAVGHWGLLAVAALGFMAPVLCAWVLAGRRLPSRRASTGVAVLVTLCTLVAMATLAPSIVYQFGVLALGLPLVFSRRAVAVVTPSSPARAGVAD